MKIKLNILIPFLILSISFVLFMTIEQRNILIEKEEGILNVLIKNQAKNKEDLLKLTQCNDSLEKILRNIQNENNNVIYTYQQRVAEIERMNKEYMENIDKDHDGMPDDFYQNNIINGDYNFNGIPDYEEHNQSGRNKYEH